MLNKLEKQVMMFLYNKCINKDSVLIDPDSIIVSLLPKYNITKAELDNIINNLEFDNYIEVVTSKDNKKNKNIYCVCLKAKGEAFKREMIRAKKTNRYLFIRKILLATVGVLVGLLIKNLFS
ncbi:MAG: hypothetical protein ACOCRO_02755 [Halanaerobiales bacterium]